MSGTQQDRGAKKGGVKIQVDVESKGLLPSTG